MSPRRIVAPPDQAALVETLRRALLEDGSKCLALGSQTSKSPCFRTKGLGVLLSAFDRVERVGPNTVRLGSGVILSDLLSVFGGPKVSHCRRLANGAAKRWVVQFQRARMAALTRMAPYALGHGRHLYECAWRRWPVRRGERTFEHLLPSFGLRASP